MRIGESDTAAVTITVAGANDLPAVSIDGSAVAVNEGAGATNTGTFLDLDVSDQVLITASVERDHPGRWPCRHLGVVVRCRRTGRIKARR